MMRPRGSSAIDSAFSRALPSISSLRPPPGSPLPPSLLFGSGSPDAPTSIWSTTTHDPASLSATNLRVTGYLGSHSRMSPPAVQTYTAGLGHEVSVTSSTPTRAGYGHQRQLSQPLAYPPPSSQHHGAWASQESSHSSILQSQSQPRHTFSPPSASFAPQQPVVGAGGLSQAPSPPYAQMHQQQQSALFPGPSQSPFSQHIPNVPLQQIHSPSVSSTLHQGLPSHSTWSYSGEGSLTGIGAPLGPFTSDLPYAQSRIQQQAQMQRSGAWAPS
ncbi:hypothetical protein K439DRAFT_1027868 [Ramaria rubella]|nr:hypothetical protein K439DRAFT_1027868 [Ramaria rubella]